MDLPTPEEVLGAIDAFLERHDMSPTRFGAESTGDPNLLAAMRNGSSPRLERLHRISAYITRKDEELGVHDGTVIDPARRPSAGNAAPLSPAETADA